MSSLAERARLHARIHGLVQGVFFRSNTRGKAISLGVTGWVRNSWDGSVELMAEGERKSLEELLEWCREGPPSARVEKINHSWEEFRGEFDSFQVKY